MASSGPSLPDREPPDQPVAAMPAAENLSFLDLFYAVPVGDLAVRVSGSAVGKLTAADWSVIAVELVALFFSWVGLHQNRADMARRVLRRDWISATGFWSFRFLQFCLEVAITILYFVVGLTLQLPDRSGQGGKPPSETWVLGTLLAIYVAYLLWDLLDMKITGHRLAQVGGLVTAAFTVIFAAGFVVERFEPARGSHAVLFCNLGAIFVLYLYRVVQDRAKKDRSTLTR